MRQNLVIKRGLSSNEIYMGSTTQLVCRFTYNGKAVRKMLVTQPLDEVLHGNGQWKPVKLYPGSSVYFRTVLEPAKSGIFTIAPPDISVESWLFKDQFNIGKDLPLTVFLSIGGLTHRIGPSSIRANRETSIFDATTIQRGRGMDFLSIRRYIGGDSLKRIDWVRSSRMSDLMVREFEDEQPTPAFFLVDIDPSMGLGEDESGLTSAVKLSAAIISKILVNDERIGAASFSGAGIEQYIYAGMGNDHMYNLRAMLSGLKTTSEDKYVRRHDHETLPYDVQNLFGREPGLKAFIDDTLRDYMANIKDDGFSRAINRVLKSLNTQSSIIIITNLSMGMTSMLNGIRIAKYYGHQVSVVLLPRIWQEDAELTGVETIGDLATLRAHGIDAVIMYPGEKPEDVIKSSGAISLKAVTRR